MLMNQKYIESKTTNEEDFCQCKCPSSIYSDTESSDFGYWDICCDCNKKLGDGFHLYNHYEGEDHDDVDLYTNF